MNRRAFPLPALLNFAWMLVLHFWCLYIFCDNQRGLRETHKLQSWRYNAIARNLPNTEDKPLVQKDCPKGFHARWLAELDQVGGCLTIRHRWVDQRTRLMDHRNHVFDWWFPCLIQAIVLTERTKLKKCLAFEVLQRVRHASACWARFNAKNHLVASHLCCGWQSANISPLVPVERFRYSFFLCLIGFSTQTWWHGHGSPKVDW